jgi:predicted metal-dependent hydrolase
VLIHELTHLTHLDHSLAFWKLLGERVPEYRAHRARLRDFAYLASWE